MKQDVSAILDRMDAGILITDKQGRVLFANSTFRKLSGVAMAPGITKPHARELQLLVERLTKPAPQPSSLKEFRERERAHILNALDQTGGRIYGPDGAAALLALPPTTLVSRLRKYGIPPRRRRLARAVVPSPPALQVEEPDFEPPMLD